MGRAETKEEVSRYVGRAMDANIWKDFEPSLCEPVVSPKRLLVSCVGWENPQRLLKGSFFLFFCLYICVWVCLRGYVCTYMYVCVHICAGAGTRVCVSVCKRPEADVRCPLQLLSTLFTAGRSLDEPEVFPRDYYS